MKYLLPFLLLPAALRAVGTNEYTGLTLRQGDAFSNVAQAGGAVSPLDQVTNQSGYPALVFYLPSVDSYTTNASVVKLANAGVGGSTWDLTNNTATFRWPVRNAGALNGKDTLLWNGTSCFLKNAAATNAQPFTIMAVMRWNDVTNGASRNFWVTAPGSVYVWQYTSGAHRLTGAGASIGGSAIRTNKWLVWTYHLNGTGSLMQTNNINDGSSASNIGGGLSGLILGSNPGGSASFAPIDLAALVIFTNSTAAVRSNAFWGLTNYFALTP